MGALSIQMRGCACIAIKATTAPAMMVLVFAQLRPCCLGGCLLHITHGCLKEKAWVVPALSQNRRQGLGLLQLHPKIKGAGLGSLLLVPPPTSQGLGLGVVCSDSGWMLKQEGSDHTFQAWSTFSQRRGSKVARMPNNANGGWWNAKPMTVVGALMRVSYAEGCQCKCQGTNNNC